MEERQIILHQGVYKKTATVWEAVFLIVGMTIGAGILGVPYAVAKVGLIPGIIYILALGIVILFLNLMIGEVAVKTNSNLQLSGLAHKYLGRWAGDLMSLIMIFTLTGVLLAYIVGEGKVLQALFGGDSAVWSVLFWMFGSIVVWHGLKAVSKVDRILVFVVLAIITGLSLWLFFHFDSSYIPSFNPLNIFLPYGVILFALNAAPAVVEAHALLPGSQKHFKKALIIGSLIPILVYIVFAIAVVGALGKDITEVASIGLGNKFGASVLLIANIFAMFSMGTGYLGVGTALKQTLIWDNKVNNFYSILFVVLAPVVLFFAGFRSFISILDLVGGLFISLISIMMVLVYWKAKEAGDLDSKRYDFEVGWLGIVVVLLVFSLATVMSISAWF